MENPAKPVVAYANWFQFGPGQQIGWARVESRMLLWCRAGTGSVVVNGAEHRMAPGAFLFLPWAHAIQYRPSARDPYLLAGIHLVPHHATDHPVEFGVAHGDGHPMEGCPWRGDAPGVLPPGLVAGQWEHTGPLAPLAEYILAVYTRTAPSEPLMRQLAELLVGEIVRVTTGDGDPAAGPRPPQLDRLLQYIRDHLGARLRMDDLIDASGMSESTIGRLFRRHLGCTAVEWITAERMRRGAEMLRTSRLTVAAVGRAVGFEDPYYFSKCFRRQMGMAPLAWRRSARIL
jgi:AraC-like DNA-binding protein